MLNFCNNKTISKGDLERENRVILVDLDSQKKEKKPIKWKYFKEWDKKSNKPIKPISNSEKDTQKSHLKVGYNNKNQIIQVNRLSYKKKFLTIKYEYNDRGNMIKQKLFLNTKREKTKIVSYYNLFKQKIEQETYIKKKNSKKYKLFRREYLNSKNLITKVKFYDDERNLMSYNSLTYDKDSNLISKKIYNRDIKLLDSAEYEKELYLHFVEHYRKDGKLIKKLFYNQEVNKLGHWNKYIYKNGRIIVYSYDPKNNLIGKEVQDAKGKTISGKIYNYKP